MSQSQTSDAPPQNSGAALRLDVRVFDTAMRKRGIEGVDAQAEALGLHRSTLFRLRRGESGPTAGTALHMAQFCRLPVDKLFPAATS
jgi:transcriptional regulator with XRE-family HTH domain